MGRSQGVKILGMKRDRSLHSRRHFAVRSHIRTAKELFPTKREKTEKIHPIRKYEHIDRCKSARGTSRTDSNVVTIYVYTDAKAICSLYINYIYSYVYNSYHSSLLAVSVPKSSVRLPPNQYNPSVRIIRVSRRKNNPSMPVPPPMM